MFFTKPGPEIEAALRSEYDSDFSGFCSKTLEHIELTNPGLFAILYKAFEICKEEDWFIMGSQMACFVYSMLERASNGHMPIVEKEVLLPVGLEAISDPREFVNKYGSEYLYEGGYFTFNTLVCFLGDALGHGMPSREASLILFIPVLMVRLLEMQVELDLAKPKNGTH